MSSEQQRLSTRQIKALGENESFCGVFLLQRLSPKVSPKNGQPYWNCSVMDGDGGIDAKIWSSADWIDLSSGAGQKKKVNPLDEGFVRSVEGTSVGVKGKVNSYRGQQQFVFEEIYLVDQEKYPPHLFVRKSTIPLEELEARFWKLLARANGRRRSFLECVFSGELWDRFQIIPAAVTHHHAYVHGLLEHTVMVTESALAMADSYVKSGTRLDSDVVIGGGLLHDIGKIDAYGLTPAPAMTLPGAVLDHVPLGFARFRSLADSFGLDEVTAMHLGHIILSHHGEKEYGSPVLPATREALIVSVADELDFRLFCYDAAVETTLPGGVSDYHAVTQRRYWKWGDSTQEAPEEK
jgi:3'-5' exoribonuclease